ncbi:hypothetical protein PTSG_00759 [Salpingoeca rosetta]|uniref:Uncharacterized protein n=1 Tax=Salpingoeca rosetta (strain ATCC 50818 / BSB-021) TaxID=946362 RepID=F2TXE0_SALR5|nr:uncharacterized protein PTSG_00759 [Salpingoeca rosetta]EGD76049.1 hypothetical protein PTSG_00759 [Salpingoeca rosetta]|eukprot:XP_004998224.1 hypothetical protein PTSG_00759 [Salpingoeca rosetta]
MNEGPGDVVVPAPNTFGILVITLIAGVELIILIIIGLIVYYVRQWVLRIRKARTRRLLKEQQDEQIEAGEAAIQLHIFDAQAADDVICNIARARRRAIDYARQQHDHAHHSQSHHIPALSLARRRGTADSIANSPRPRATRASAAEGIQQRLSSWNPVPTEIQHLPSFHASPPPRSPDIERIPTPSGEYIEYCVV